MSYDVEYNPKQSGSYASILLVTPVGVTIDYVRANPGDFDLEPKYTNKFYHAGTLYINTLPTGIVPTGVINDVVNNEVSAVNFPRLLWLRADTNTFQLSSGVTVASGNADPIARWNDCEGGSYYAIQSGATSKRPTLRLSQVNGYPAIRFDGSDDALQVPALPIGLFTMFIVCRPTYPGILDSNPRFFIEHSPTPNTNHGHQICISNDDTTLNVVARGAAGVNKSSYSQNGSNTRILGTDWCIIIHDYQSGTHAHHLLYRNSNTIPLSTVTFSTNTANPGNAQVTDTLNICSRNNTSFFTQADIAEIVIYSTGLTPDLRGQILTKLATKYNMPTSG